MKTMKTTELTGATLDWAVAKCEGVINGDDLDIGFIRERGYTPSTDWAQGGQIIEREKLSVEWIDSERWLCGWHSGKTPLIAAMRCYVTNKLGDEVDVPEELV